MLRSRLVTTADRLHRLHKAVEDCGFSSLADALIHELDAVDDEGPTGQRARAFYRSDCVRLLNTVVNDKGIASNMSEGNTFVNFAANFISDVLEQEIDAISTNTIFAPHNMDKQQAPILHALFHRLVKTESHNAGLDIEGDTDMVSALDEESEQKSQRPLDRSLIATTALGMLCYARNRSSNALQGIMGHFLFAMNTARSCMEVLHRLGLSVPYETVTATLKANSLAAQEQLRLQVSRRRFLISVNNYHKRQNARDIGHERGHEVTHSAGYVCLMKCCDKDKCECGSLPLNSIDHSGAKRVSRADFIPTKETAEYLTLTRNSLFGQALMRHCGKAMRKQRNDHGNIMHQVEDPPLQHIRAASGKAQIFTLKTFDQDQATVDAAIRNIDNICTELGIGETEIADKVVMFHGDDLTVRDITIAKYLRVRDIGPFEQFTWIEPIAGLFHLQMNVLKMLMHIFEGGIMDPASLQRFRFLFGREGVDKEVKDFHACDEFFRNVSDAHILALFMHQHGIRTVGDLDIMLGESDWPAAIRNVVKDGVGDIFRVTGIRKTALDSIRDEVDARMKKLQQEREELLRKRRQIERETGKKYRSLQPPQWNKLRRKIERDLTGPKRDIVNENALLFLQCALVYQDFHEACRDGFSGRVEKCIELFALMFQGTKFRHYAADCLHLVACLKHIWKPEFKQVWLSYCLIDPDGRGEYCGLDRYGETLIRENKDKVRPYAKPKDKEFPRVTIARNVPSLRACKQTMFETTGITEDAGHRQVSSTDTMEDVAKICARILGDEIFTMHPGRGSGEFGWERGRKVAEVVDIFGRGIQAFASGVPIAKYLEKVQHGHGAHGYAVLERKWGGEYGGHYEDDEDDEDDDEAEDSEDEEKGDIMAFNPGVNFDDDEVVYQKDIY